MTCSLSSNKGWVYGGQDTDRLECAGLAYLGKLTKGTQTGDYINTGLGWKGQVLGSTTQISSPNNAVLLTGRLLVEIDSDLSTA